MALFQPPSPLDKLEGLEPVDPEKAKKLEDHLAATVLPKVVKGIIEDHKRAMVLRHKPLFGRIRI